MKYPARVKAATLLVLAIAIYSAGSLLKATNDMRVKRKGMPDEITFTERRFQALKPVLPTDSRIGYVTDMPNIIRRYYTMRYVLSPVWVLRREDCPTAVGNFGKLENIYPMAREKGFVVERNLGGGVVLLRKRGR